jgi:HEAT repeat protein
MRNWRAMLVVAMLAVTVPLVLAGCKGQAGTPSSKTAAATPNEHEGHDHEEAAAKSEETPFEEHATSDKVARLLEDLQSADDHRIVEALEGIIQIKVADERDQLKDAVRKLLLSPDSSAEVRVAAITAWKAWVATDPDPDPYVRRRAAAALIVVPPDGVQDQLKQSALHDPSPDVRRFAVEAMSNLKGDEAGYAVAACLRDPDAQVRLYACEVLKKIGTRKQTDALLRLFEDPDEDVRWKAVDAVAQFADPAAKDALIAALSDPSARVAQAAERGVHRLGIGARVLTKEERLGLGPRR